MRERSNAGTLHFLLDILRAPGPVNLKLETERAVHAA